jgi:hypothetical protein
MQFCKIWAYGHRKYDSKAGTTALQYSTAGTEAAQNSTLVTTAMSRSMHHIFTAQHNHSFGKQPQQAAQHAPHLGTTKYNQALW